MGKKLFQPILRLQLGKNPKGEFKVIKLCRFGFPQLLENSPFWNGKPFPNLFWLTCPYLVREVSKLESEGYIEHFEERLRREEPFRRRYIHAHQLEASLRKLKIPLEVPESLKKKLLTVGIGGIENPLGVKCLHLHLASYWGGVPDPIGREVLKLLPSWECSDNYCGKMLNV